MMNRNGIKVPSALLLVPLLMLLAFAVACGGAADPAISLLINPARILLLLLLLQSPAHRPNPDQPSGPRQSATASWG